MKIIKKIKEFIDEFYNVGNVLKLICIICIIVALIIELITISPTGIFIKVMILKTIILINVVIIIYLIEKDI